MASGDTKTESYLRAAAEGTREDLPSDTCCNTKTQNLILGVANRIMDVEDEVEELKNNPDVVDIVDTYADLEAYDTQHLTENDIIRVLQDETHDNNSTYYRFTKNPDTWTFIGEISGGGSSVNVVQTTGTSTTDVMSQNATTEMIYSSASSQNSIKIGAYTSVSNNIEQEIAIGSGLNGGSAHGAKVTGWFGIAVGYATTAGRECLALGAGATANPSGTGIHSSVAVGPDTTCSHDNSVALGKRATTTRVGEVNIGSGAYNNGYNSTSYRVLGGVYDGQDAHDAVTVGQVNATIDAINTALSTNIPHIGA